MFTVAYIYYRLQKRHFTIQQMVGLYKDPEGEKISFMSSVVERSIGGGNEVKALRQRVAELEHNLRKRVSIYLSTI